MAGIKDSFVKGLATINVKTSNFMEENKLKTHITTLQEEIENLEKSIGEKVYKNWLMGTFTIEKITAELEAIKEKYEIIENRKAEIKELSINEKQILGGSYNESSETKFCKSCGNKYEEDYKFCQKCGNKL